MGLISYLFGLMFLIVPLIFFPKTSELFEFNKMIAVYIFTILIAGSWILEMIQAKKILFKRTLLDIPILIYLGTSLISTVFSIDVHTSIFGYYGRFNGGLLSLLSYAVLYWAFVSNIKVSSNGNQSTIVKYQVSSMLIGAAIVSVYGIFEHFGHSFSCLIFTGSFDDSCWVQDVKTRVFATLGQPNWLAAYLISLVPLTWYGALKQKQETKSKFIWGGISVLILLAIWFTKSRSGLGGLGAAIFVFIGLVAWKKSKEFAIGFCILAILITGLFAARLQAPSVADNGGQGGTDSGEIRQLVWTGAIGVWQHYPILGSGLETFAYTFPKFRPVAHNLTSEWNFVYNKAHNEYLNVLATSGVVGIISYTVLIVFSVIQIFKGKSKLLNISLLAGYISILVTNFFGFSVVVTQLFLFLLPAMAIAFHAKHEALNTKNETSTNQKILIGGVLFITCYLLLITSRYWYADYLYAQSKTFAEEKKYSESTHSILSAISISPSEPVYHDELAGQLAQVAVLLKEKSVTDSSESDFAQKADDEGKVATSLSFYNVPLRKSRIRDLLILSDVDKNYLTEVLPFIEETQQMDGNDPFVFVEKGKAYVKLGQIDMAIEAYKKAVELKANYQDARYALGLLYKLKKNTEDAKIQFQYILDNLSPEDALVKKELKGL